jgi:uncharacterized protein
MNLVDDYILNLEGQQQKIAQRLRQMLLTLVPGIQEKFSFKIPFYHYFGMFCYINAVPNGIDLGFCRGKDLVTEFSSLQMKNRAMVASVCLYSIKEIEQKEVREIIIAAALWNEEAKKKRVPMVNKRKAK